MSSQKCGLSTLKPTAASKAARRVGTACSATTSWLSVRSARLADWQAYHSKKATPNHRTKLVSQGNHSTMACSPQMLAKIKTISIKPQVSRIAGRCRRIRPCRRMKALCAPTTANSPGPVAARLAHAEKKEEEVTSENIIGIRQLLHENERAHV